MSPQRANALRHSALLNLNAFAEWFCGVLGDPEFQRDYERARRRYVRETRALFTGFRELPNVKAYPSAANFALIELDRSAAEVVGALLTRHGIYVRDCVDKAGLDGRRFIRRPERGKRIAPFCAGSARSWNVPRWSHVPAGSGEGRRTCGFVTGF